LIEKAQKWGLENCLFLPYQPRDVLPFSLTACDLSLVTVEEGMSGIVAPSKLYSVLATGRPLGVICDSECFLRDLVEQIKCGVSFANGDSQGLADFIRQMARNPKLAKAMGRAGRHYLISQCTLETIADQYLSALGVSVGSEPAEVFFNPEVEIGFY
jgi:glycosyltransferase involved in cell wall biosynthesis